MAESGQRGDQSPFGYTHLGNWHEFRSQVPLMGLIPDTTSPDPTEFQDALSARRCV